MGGLQKNVNNFCRFRKVDYFCFTIFGKMAVFNTKEENI